MRTRLAAAIAVGGKAFEKLGDHVLQEQGVRVPWTYGHDWPKFLATADLRDVLDLVTIAYQTTLAYDRGSQSWEPDRGKGKGWLETVRRVFREENLRYLVDDKGGVHFAIDDEFERNSATTIKALDAPRYAAARANFDNALAHLSAAPVSAKDAIRSVFAANEGLFRLMFTKAPRLTADEADHSLAPLLQKLNAGDPASAGASAKLLRSFKEWIEAAHFYRHEPGHEEPKEPPLEIAVLMVSSGAIWLRWLAELDQKPAGQ
jgi:hypothetical protein